MHLRPRAARPAACATAALLVMTTGLAIATPADAATPRLPYRATTSTGVIRLQLTLPAAPPGLPKVIDLTLLGTDGQGFHGATGKDVATARSFLAGGSLVTGTPLAAGFAPLSRAVTADLAHPGTKGAPAFTLPANPLGLSLGAITQVASSNATSKAVSSSSALASTSLGSLGSLGLGPVLTPVFSGVTTAVTALTTAITPLTDVLNGLPGVPGVTVPNPVSPVLGGPPNIPTPPLKAGTLVATLNELPAQITALQDKLTNGAVVKLGALTSKESITPATSSVASTGQSGVVNGIDLFGGLVHLTVATAKVSATSAATRDAASATATATLLSVKVSDAFGTLLSAVAGDQGLTASLLDGKAGTVLAPTTKTAVMAVDAALKTLEAQLQKVLAMLGGSAPLQGVATHSVSSDGSVAKAHAAPASIGFSLPGAPKLLALSVGVADAVSSQTVAAPAVVVTPVVNVPRTLPHTGGSTPAALLALGLLAVGGGSVLVRRRVAQH